MGMWLKLLVLAVAIHALNRQFEVWKSEAVVLPAAREQGHYIEIEHPASANFPLESFPDTAQWGTQVARKVKLYYELDIAADLDAELLVLIHPSGANADYWDGALRSYKLLAAARGGVAKMHILRVDIRGQGRSEHTAGPFSIPLFAADLDLLLDAVRSKHGVAGNSTKVHLVGNSVGAGTAMQYSVDHPEKVASLVYSGYTAKCDASLLQWGFSRSYVVITLGMNMYAKAVNMASFVRYENWDGLRAFFQSNDPIAYCKVASSWDGFDILSQLPSVSAPVLAMYPEWDVKLEFTLAEVSRDVSLFKNGKVKQVAQRSHFFPFEDPTEYVTILLDFYKQAGIETIVKNKKA